MAREIELSESEIVQALANARSVNIPDPPGSFLVSEIARKSRKSPRSIRMQIQALDEQGLIERVTLYRKGSDGRQLALTGFRILKKARR